MDALVIEGGTPLRGTIPVRGAKNAALPLIAACILTDREVNLNNVPALRDIRTMIDVLRAMGADVSHSGENALAISGELSRFEAPYELVRTMRASILVLGPLLARYGRARVSLPGGCAIGARPIDQHLKGLKALGAELHTEHGYVEAHATKLRGAHLVCDLVTVTGTMNLMMAATLAEGTTTIDNAAQEPEVIELATALNKMGARISNAGTSTLTIEGVDQLGPLTHSVMPDRIEAGTFMVGVAATGGDAIISECNPEHLTAVIDKLKEAGVEIHCDQDTVRVRRNGRLNPIDITTHPYPGFPTDMQAQFMILALVAEGQSRITETIFENRFMHVPELCRMNANITISGRTALVGGPTKLTAATVMASDLRASAALVLAGLIASDGPTRIRRVYHLDRGYEQIEKRLCAVGAKIERVSES